MVTLLLTRMADLVSGSESAQDDRDAFFATGGEGEGFANSAAEIGSEASRVEDLGSAFDALEATVVMPRAIGTTFFGAGGDGAALLTADEIGSAPAAGQTSRVYLQIWLVQAVDAGSGLLWQWWRWRGLC